MSIGGSGGVQRQRLIDAGAVLSGPSTYQTLRIEAGLPEYGIDIDDCIRQTMLMADTLRGGGQDHPVPGDNYRFPELQR